LNKEELPQQRKEPIIVSLYKKGDKIVIIEGYHCYQPHTKFYPVLLSRLTLYRYTLNYEVFYC